VIINPKPGRACLDVCNIYVTLHPQIQRGDKIVGPSFKGVIAALKNVDPDTQHVELHIHRPGNSIGNDIINHVADRVPPECHGATYADLFNVQHKQRRCTVSYNVGETGLMNQHMAHLSAIEFALLSGCVLRLAKPTSRVSFNITFPDATFNPIPFSSLYDLPHLQVYRRNTS
jgi:hypothetical protein